MGVLKKFEQRLEGLVNGTFAKVFKSEVQPVEIAGALQRECDNNATIWNRDRTVVPNDFIVELSTPDFERLSPYSGQLGDELAGMVRDYAKQQRYTFMGPIKVHLEKADDLDTGLYRVRSRTLASSTSHQGGPAAAALPLTRREFDLLAYLAAHADQVMSRQRILAEVWQQPYVEDQTVDVHLSALRRKMGEKARKPRYLHTVRGIGIKLVSAP